MSIFRLVLGVCFLLLGSAYVLGRDRFGGRSWRLRGWTINARVLNISLGSLYCLIGSCWLITAFA